MTKQCNRVRESLKASGLIREVFTFVDSWQLLSRVNVWESRDRALADRENEEQDETTNRKLNNLVVRGRRGCGLVTSATCQLI